MNFYIADMHLGHRNVILFDNRPFDSVEQMDMELIKRWNRVVSQDDHVYILGDFTMKGPKYALEYAQKLKGHKHLIIGNHDRHNDNYYSCFESADKMLTVNDTVYGFSRKVFLCHYWIPFVAGQRYGAYILHGHTHITKEYVLEEEMKRKIRDNGIRCEAFNVGCMYQDYYPQTLEQIIERQNRKVII